MRGIPSDAVTWLCGLTLGLGLTATPTSTFAQQTTYGTRDEEGNRVPDFRIRTVDPKFLPTPNIQSDYPKPGVVGGTPVKWLRVEVVFDSNPDWADNVEFRWYIAVAGDKKPVVFTDSVTHINVKRGSRHLSAIFMPPRTADRYAKNGQVRQIAVQLWYDQKLMDTAGWPSEPKTRWWEDFKPERGALLNLLQTPFGALDYDRYEQIRTIPVP